MRSSFYWKFSLLLLGILAMFWLTSRNETPEQARALTRAQGVMCQDSGLNQSCREAVPSRSKLMQLKPKVQGTALATPGTGVIAPLDKLWLHDVPEPTFAEFRNWTNQFIKQADAADYAEGLRLAQERRREMADMIDQHPRRALELAVPLHVRKLLPEGIQAELEEPVRGRGDYLVAAAVAMPGKELLVPAIQREVVMQKTGRRYAAFTYGLRTELSSRNDMAIQGISLDGKLALSDVPGRLMEASEIKDLKSADPSATVCPTSGLPTESNGDEVVVDWDGDHQTFFCGPNHATDQLLEAASMEASALPPIASANGSASGGSGIVAESTYTEGAKKMLIIRVDFPDKTGQVVSDATLTTLISNFNTHWTEMSYGKTTWALVGAGSAFTPTLRLPLGHASYTGFGTMLSAARAAAEDAGFDYRTYNFDVVVTGDKPDVGFGGVAYVGGRGAWLANSQWNLGVGTHEVGHNFGLNHSGYWNTDDGSVIGTGTAVEYGNPFDHMGGASSSFNAHFGARQKNYLDWLPDTDVKKVTTNATVTHRISAMDKAAATGARAVAVDRSSTTNDYWVECRQTYAGSNKWQKDGVLLNWGPVSINNSKPLLLDLTPATSTLDDAALLIGQTFSDPTDKIHITPVGKGADANGVTWMDITVNRGDFPSNAKPTVTIVATPNNPAINATTSFTATASDPNGDPLSYFWDWGSGNFTANNSPTASTSWTTSGIKPVRCIVSDMKGMIATGSALVQVGTTTTFYISGVVKSAAGIPLSGVTVRADSTHSDATDSEGFFAITNLAAGNYTVTPSFSGLQFAVSGFTNPVTVGPSKQNINFNALPGAPSFGTMKPALVDQGSNTGAIPIPVNDPDTAITALTITATSSNTAIIPNSGIAIATSGSIRTVTVSAGAAVSGTVNITLNATDGAASATYVWPVTINARPVLTAVAQTTAENTPLSIDLRTLVTDDSPTEDFLRFETTRPLNGSISVQPDGHTALFTPSPNFDGAASFYLKAYDQSLSSRTLILLDFESPDTTADSKADDKSNFNRRATYQSVGNGEFSYVTTVPSALVPFSGQALSLTENGNGNAARATVSLAATDLNVNDASWSFTTWIRRVSADSEDFVLHLGDGDGHGTKEELSCYFVAGSNALHLAKFGTAGVQKEIIGPDVSLGEWHHVGVVYARSGTNTGTLSLYVDGFLAGSATGAAMALSQSFPLVLGGTAVDTATTDRWFDGLFDDVMLVSGVLSAAELQALSRMGTPHQLGLSTTAVPISVSVTGVNHAPTIADVADVGLNVSQTSAGLPIAVADAESESRILTVSAASSNLTLLPVSGIAVSAAPAAWTHVNIGAVGAVGSVTEDHGTLILGGSGADIGGTLDEFRYAHQALTGDGTVIVRVSEMDFTNELSKAGIMFREGAAANAAYAMVMVTPGSGVSFQARTTAGGAAIVNATVNRVAAPCWLRLTLSSGNVTAAYAPDLGTTPTVWLPLGTPQPLTLTAAAQVGLAVSSRADGTVCNAVFDQISGRVNLGGERSVTLTPAAGESGTATVTLTVSDGSLTATDSFQAVIGVNTPPSVSAVSNITSTDGSAIPSFNLDIGDLHTPVANLIVTAATSSTLLLPTNRITFTGTGSARTVNLSPIPGETGTITVTLTVSDGVDSAQRTFTLTINPGDEALLVPAGGNWRYLDDGTNPTNWKQPSFIDSTWPIGPAQLGNGDGDENTLLALNPARISTYFRRNFAIGDIYAYSQLKLRLVRDDGVVIYLNGQEILRDNMPTGTILSNTSASVVVSGTSESAWREFTINAPPLVAGSNVLAVELHQSGTASSDLSFDLEVLGSNPAPIQAIPMGADWHYLDDGTDPGTTWINSNFVETAAWKSGPAQLGYGDGDEITLIGGGPTTARFTTSYFRQSFTVTDPSQVNQAVLRYLRDDGAVIYLNGQEIIRDNLPTGAILASTKAVVSVGNADELKWHSVRIDPTRLLAGNNILAVEIHQNSTTSSDVSFDLQLLTYASEALPPLRCACTPTTVIINWPTWAPGWQLQSSSNMQTWTNVTTPPAAGQGQYQVTLPRSSVKLFYRLVGP
jgi:hypothetical protein